MGQNLDYLSTNQPTDEYTHKLQHRVLEMRDDKEWRENYMTWEMKLDERYETGHKAGREEERWRKHLTMNKLFICQGGGT